MTNQNPLFYLQIYVTQSETRVIKSEVEEPLLVTNQNANTIVQSEPDRPNESADEFHVDNNDKIPSAGTTEMPMEIDQSETKNESTNEIDQSETTKKNESELKEKQNLPTGMDFATAIMEDDLEAFEAIRKLFYNCIQGCQTYRTLCL